MKFEKWSGLGNDFIFTTGKELPPGLDARKLCDRKNGIGAGARAIPQGTAAPGRSPWRGNALR